MLSVIVPTRLAYGKSPRTLTTLSRQDIDPSDVELIIVVDGAEPGRLAALRSMRWPFVVNVIEQPNRGQAAARNRGAAAARGDYLVFIDDDVELPPRFLREIEQGLMGGADVVVPAIRIGPWTPETVAVREARQTQHEYDKGRPDDFPVRFDDVAFAATGIRRASFEGVGGFDASFTEAGAYGNEDVDLTYRLLVHGAVICRAPGTVALTDEPHELVDLLERAQKVGRNDVLLVKKHPELATEVLGRKLIDSRIHRLVGMAVMRFPMLSRLHAPLLWAVMRFVYGRPDDGSIRFRLWFALRALHYWRGVTDAGGRPIARAARSAVSSHPYEGRRGPRSLRSSGSQDAGRSVQP